MGNADLGWNMVAGMATSLTERVRLAWPAVQIRELAVPDAYEIVPRQFGDDRGVFLEWYRSERLAEVLGHPLPLAQANCSVSKRGVLRGIHFADVPPGQAKYVTCLRGAVLDVAVDVRVGSPAYGSSDSVLLDDRDRRVIYLAEGLGHAFLALTDDATVAYLCSEPYAPQREHAVHPLDPELGLPWPGDVEPLLSPKDAEAPTLARAREQGVLPAYEACRAYYDELRAVR
jgi:dTDP-4-dehydrorhamnose 3,5-epimerase